MPPNIWLMMKLFIFVPWASKVHIHNFSSSRILMTVGKKVWSKTAKQWQPPRSISRLSLEETLQSKTVIIDHRGTNFLCPQYLDFPIVDLIAGLILDSHSSADIYLTLCHCRWKLSDFSPTPYSSVYFQTRGNWYHHWNWWLSSGIREFEKNWEKKQVIEGGRGGEEWVWVAPLCGSFYCPFHSPIKASQHKLKVTVDIPTPKGHTQTH